MAGAAHTVVACGLAVSRNEELYLWISLGLSLAYAVYCISMILCFYERKINVLINMSCSPHY